MSANFRRYYNSHLPWLIMLWMLPGCAWMPDEGRRAEFAQSVEAGKTLASARRQEPDRTSTLWPKHRWWLQFNSTELNRLIDLALMDSPDLKAASARLRQTDALARVEGARLLPFLDAQTGFGTERLSGNGYNVVLRGAHIVSAFVTPLSLRYQFDFWGKNRAALEAALGEAAAEEAERNDVHLQLTAAITRAYFRGTAYRAQLGLLHELTGLQHDLLTVATTRFQLGLDSADPVKQASFELETVNKRAAVLRDQITLQQNLLARLTGHGPDSAPALRLSETTLPQHLPLPSSLPLELVAHRPDLAAALHRAEAAAQRIQVAKASFLPTVDLTAFVGLSAIRMTKGASALANLLFSGSSFAYGVAPGVRLPIFEGGRLRGQLSAQRAEYDSAVESYNKTLLQAVQEVADSLSNWRRAREVVDAHGRSLDARREAAELASERWRTGLDDKRALLARRIEERNQELALTTLQSDQFIAMTDLIEALGGGYSSGLAAANLPTPPESIGTFDN